MTSSTTGSSRSQPRRGPSGRGRRRLGRMAAAAGVVTVVATLGPLALTAPAHAAETCVNQITGQTMTANKVGTSGDDIFSPTASNPAFRIQSGDVVSTKEGNDNVFVDNTIHSLVVCLGSGIDRLSYTDPLAFNNAPGPFSIMGGPGGDNVAGSQSADGINGGDGADVADASPLGDNDTCVNVENAGNCEN